MSAPLIVTLEIDPAVQQRLDADRLQWFPPGRTVIGAHVTLFHALPGGVEAQVRADLETQAGARFDIRLAQVMSLGRGAAYAIESAELARHHKALQRLWQPHLTRQDQQGFRPHVTIANKLDAEQARTTLEALRTSFTPCDVAAIGFQLWRYDGGPWTHLADIPFAPHPS